MKLLIFIHSMGAGGAERVTANLANAWAQRGWKISVVTLASVSADFYSLRSDVKRIALNLAGDSSDLMGALRANLLRLWTLRRLLRAERPDVVLGMMTGSAVLSILAARGLGCRVLVSERIFPPFLPLGRIWEGLRRVCYPWAFRVIMQSKEGVTWLKSQIPSAKGTIIPNPVRYPLPAQEPTLSPASFILPERKLLLAVGRLDRQKGFELLLEAFSALAERYTTWDLVILGEGVERDSLERQIASLRLEARVTLPGRAGNLADWYCRSDLFVLSSRFEGFPNTLLEAMAHGCAVISYDCKTGPSDIIRDQTDGLLVSPVGDVPALTGALISLFDDSALRNRLAQRAVEVRDRYAMEIVQAMWDKLIEDET